jgi:L-ribulokinase
VKKDCFVMGVDYGTDSVRSVIINASTGEEITSSVFLYPRWRDGLYCNAGKQQFRQHPLDYVEGLEQTIKNCLKKAGHPVAENIKAISVDTTGSTPVATDETGTPLALFPEFENNPNAMFVLWKDHTSVREAAQINEHSKTFSKDYLKYVGGIYSSEWFWAKLLHVLRQDKDVRKACYSWVEHCDWIPFLLTGGKHVSSLKRGVCSAGHKALWASEFGGLPPGEFFSSLDPLLEGFRERLFTNTYTADKPAGKLSQYWAERLGLSTEVTIGIGAFDAHMGAVGGQIEPYYLSKVMGTSTCDMLVAPAEDMKARLPDGQGKLVKGICGQVDGSIIPGMIGLEAGQSAFGDAYAWFKNILAWPLRNLMNETPAKIDETIDKIISELNKQAAELPVDENSELAMDWMNGRRTPDANQLLKGGFTGLTLGTDAPGMFRALAEATCFGAKKIVDRFNYEGIPVKGLIGLGGVAKRSPFIMQMMADVMNMPIRIHRSEQTCAAGAAMFAATAAGIYSKVEDAMTAMGSGFDAEYFPDTVKAAIYTKRYRQYDALGNFIEQQIATNQHQPKTSATALTEFHHE